MSKEVNGVLLKHLFQLAEEDRQNGRLLELLEKTIDKVVCKPRSIDLEFSNGTSVLISNNLDYYYIYISDPKFYENDETAYSPMGYDRIMRYLRNISQFKYDWRSINGSNRS